MAPQRVITEPRYAIIGAGPSGLAGARNLSKRGIGFEPEDGKWRVTWRSSLPDLVGGEPAQRVSTSSTSEYCVYSKRLGEASLRGAGNEGKLR